MERLLGRPTHTPAALLRLHRAARCAPAPQQAPRRCSRSAVCVSPLDPVFQPEEEDDDEPDEKLVAEVLYALLAASGVGVPAQQVLPKFSAVLTPHSLTSVLVGLSRKQAWAAAEATAVWARAASLELPAASYVRVAQRRAEGGHWEQAVQALGWMSDFACVPSGDTVHAVAELVNLGGARVDPARLRPFIAWLRGTEAGRALWHVYAPQLAAGEEGPAWRSTGLMTEQVDELLSGPLPDLKEALREIMPTEMAAGEVAEAPVLDTFEDIDDLLRARSAR